MDYTKEDRLRHEFILRVEKFKETDNLILYKEIRRSRLSLYTYRQNYIELRRALDFFHDKVESSNFWSNHSPHLRWNTQKIITTRIFNYLSSVSAIIDTSRINSDKHLSSSFEKNYKAHVTKVFVNNSEFAFLRDLRNYISHYSLLDIGVYSNIDYETGRTNMVYLSSDRLVGWSSWKSESKTFLLKHDKIDIESTISKYHDKFVSTQNMLFLGIIEKYSGQLSTLITAMEDLLAEAQRFSLVSSMPFRPSTLRYLKCLVSQIENRTAHNTG